MFSFNTNINNGGNVIFQAQFYCLISLIHRHSFEKIDSNQSPFIPMAADR